MSSPPIQTAGNNHGTHVKSSASVTSPKLAPDSVQSTEAVVQEAITIHLENDRLSSSPHTTSDCDQNTTSSQPPPITTSPVSSRSPTHPPDKHIIQPPSPQAANASTTPSSQQLLDSDDHHNSVKADGVVDFSVAATPPLPPAKSSQSPQQSPAITSPEAIENIAACKAEEDTEVEGNSPSRHLVVSHSATPELTAADIASAKDAVSSTTEEDLPPPLESPASKRRMLNDGSGFVVSAQTVPQMWRQSQQVHSPSDVTQATIEKASSSHRPLGTSGTATSPVAAALREQQQQHFDADAAIKYESGASLYQSGEDGRQTRGGRVLLLRNLTPSVVESDVEAFVSPFTRTASPKIYLQFAAGQAFVEFGTLQEAQHAYQYFKAHPTSLKGQTVQVHFSDRQCVTAPDDKNTDFRVLLATVTNLMYPVDIELLRFLFSRFGTVQKIISFSKTSSTFQALIQMADPQMARDALQALHSRNIYDGCNTLQIQPSRLPELTVRNNNNRAWDYTINPEGVPARCNSNENGGLLTSQPRPSNNSPSIDSQSAPIGQDENQIPPNMPGQNRCQSPAFNKVFSMPRLPKEVREWKSTVMSNASAPTNVLIVYNLTPNVVTVTELFNVFSLYGILQRVKILRDKPHTALLQYSDPLYASLAAHFLQQAAFFDQKQGIQIGFSRNAEVKLSHAVGPENLKRTRAFQPQEQRYNPNEVEKFIRAACSPTCTLFIANLREDIDEATIRSLVQRYGTATKIQLKAPTDGSRRRFAMVEMSNKHEALCALAYLHNTFIEHSSIKVAFSKRVISDGLSDNVPLSPGLEGCEVSTKETTSGSGSTDARPITASTTTN